jgi:RNA polymerase sigma factor (sigma-70 family)
MLSKLTKNKDSEVGLLERFVKADSETLLYLYKNYLPSITRYVCTNGGNEEDARDVFQEALLVLYKQTKTGNFKLSASLKTYIFSVCRFQWLKCIRKNKRIESLTEGFEVIDLNSDAVKLLEKAEKFVLLQSHLSRLSSTSQQIMDLYFQKYSTQQIADKLGLSKLYVKKRKYELKKELIESIQNDSRYCEMKSID